MRCLILFIAFVFPTWCLSETLPGPLVETKSGRVRGHYLTSYKGNRYEAYQGIPYALPPTGERRFQPPSPIQPWSQELMATNMSQPCPQEKLFTHELSGSEDCLYLNVYVPTTRKQNESLPVLFFIHDGGFQVSGTAEAEEHYVIDYNVIFVSTQFRIGFLGFLSTEDDVVPGNMGLKDQSTALRWVHDNVEHFGGDPKKITLVGFGSGGVSVHFHYLSPWSRGLFHAGISMSGTAFAPWALVERAREETVELGQLANCTDANMRLVIECLRARPIHTLLSLQLQVKTARNQPFEPFTPIVEKSSAAPFIDDQPIRIISRGEAYDVPWITGVASEEGLAFTGHVANDNLLKEVDANWYEFAKIWLGFYYTLPEEQHRNACSIIREHYFQNKPINMENLRSFTNLAGDRMFKVSAENAAVQQASANQSPVFFYHYGYRATDSNSHAMANTTENLGVCHGDDVGLVLKNSRVNPTKSPRDMEMQRRLIEIWTSVARHGVPQLDTACNTWLKVSPNRNTFDYLQIDDPSSLVMQSSDNFGQKMFWNTIDFNENKI